VLYIKLRLPVTTGGAGAGGGGATILPVLVLVVPAKAAALLRTRAAKLAATVGLEYFMDQWWYWLMEQKADYPLSTGHKSSPCSRWIRIFRYAFYSL
jgi:hypothetical protein